MKINWKNSKSKEKTEDKKPKINHIKAKNLETIDLKEQEINEIIINNHYIPIIKYISNTKTKTKYIFNSKSKNFIYYNCHLQNNWKGKGKVDIIIKNLEYKTKLLTIINNWKLKSIYYFKYI